MAEFTETITKTVNCPHCDGDHVVKMGKQSGRFRLLLVSAHFINIRCRRPATSNSGPASVAGSSPTEAGHCVSSSTFSETPAWAA